MLGFVVVAPLTGLTNVLVAAGSMPLRSDSHARKDVSESRAAGVASRSVRVPSRATPTDAEFHPPVWAPVTPLPLTSSPLGETPGAYSRECRPSCLLYTSDAADDLLCVDLGGRRIIKKK